MGARIPIRRSEAAGWARTIGALPVPVLVIGALAHRTGFLPTSYLLGVLAIGFILALVALALASYALIDIWVSGAEGAADAGFGLAYAFPALVVLGFVAAALVMYPAVNDVTTDLEDPPVFSTSVPGSGAPVASVPSPLVGIPGRLYDLPLEQVYAAARTLVDARGWEIVDEMPPRMPGPMVAEGGILLPVPRPAENTDGEGGRALAPALPERPATIEAVARTLLLSIPDGVSIRLIPTPDGISVDMRSRSAIGEHDLGENSRRIRRFLSDLDAVLQGRGGLGGDEEEGEPELERP